MEMDQSIDMQFQHRRDIGVQPAAAALKKGPWTEEEDEILMAYITKHGAKKWDEAAKKSGLRRGGKSCRLRWKNQLHPRLKKEPITHQEKEYIIQLYNQYGSKWSLIASHVAGRSDNAVKNVCNSLMKKKKRMRAANIVQFPAPLTTLLQETNGELPSIQMLPSTTSPLMMATADVVEFSNSLTTGIEEEEVDFLLWDTMVEDLLSLNEADEAVGSLILPDSDSSLAPAPAPAGDDDILNEREDVADEEAFSTMKQLSTEQWFPDYMDYDEEMQHINDSSMMITMSSSITTTTTPDDDDLFQSYYYAFHADDDDRCFQMLPSDDDLWSEY